jgi:endonuclease III
VVVDAHVYRISPRLELTTNTDANKIELRLRQHGLRVDIEAREYTIPSLVATIATSL